MNNSEIEKCLKSLWDYLTVRDEPESGTRHSRGHWSIVPEQIGQPPLGPDILWIKSGPDTPGRHAGRDQKGGRPWGIGVKKETVSIGKRGRIRRGRRGRLSGSLEVPCALELRFKS